MDTLSLIDELNKALAIFLYDSRVVGVSTNTNGVFMTYAEHENEQDVLQFVTIVAQKLLAKQQALAE